MFTSVFRYEAGKDSVLQVTRESYEKCNTTSPKATYTDGNTKVKLNQPGPVYFISGTEGHCQKGQKLRLVVISPRNSVFAPAPSPTDGPAIAPTSGAAKLTGVFGVVVGIVLGFCAFFWEKLCFNFSLNSIPFIWFSNMKVEILVLSLVLLLLNQLI